jgi:DNA recombination protein RmuC
MNTEVILLIVVVFLISLLMGSFLTAKFLPNFLKSVFRDTAKETLSEVTKEVSDSQDQYEEGITQMLKDLNKTVTEAKSVWARDTSNITKGFDELAKSYIAWEESLSNPGEQGALAEEALEVMLKTAGLVKGVNFDTQITEHTEEGMIRPDFYVYTPDDGVIVIDSKAPMKFYKEAIKAESELEKKEKLQQHATNMLQHAISLGERDYTQAVGRRTPDVVIMYVPNIAIYLSAIEHIPDLIQRAWNHRVTICPPEALYPVLKNIMLSWQQKKLYENVEEMHTQTKVIHDRLKKFHGHYAGIGKALTNASKAFNRSVSSWESRLKPAFRKLENMGIAEDRSRQIAETDQIEEDIVKPKKGDESPDE